MSSKYITCFSQLNLHTTPSNHTDAITYRDIWELHINKVLYVISHEPSDLNTMANHIKKSNCLNCWHSVHYDGQSSRQFNRDLGCWPPLVYSAMWRSYLSRKEMLFAICYLPPPRLPLNMYLMYSFEKSLHGNK